MAGLVLRTRALVVQNRGGGYPTKMIREETKDMIGRKRVRTRQIESLAKVSGSDYVTFVCPGCGTRNKRCVTQYRNSTPDGSISFKCHRCYNEIECARPHKESCIVLSSRDEVHRYQKVERKGVWQ